MLFSRLQVVLLIILVLTGGLALQAQDGEQVQPGDDKPAIEVTDKPGETGDKKDVVAREEGDKPAETGTVKAEDQPDGNQPIAEKKPEKQVAPVRKEKPGKKTAGATVAETGLLEATDPRIIYGRIPGMTFEQPKPDTAGVITLDEKLDPDMIKVTPQEEKKENTFGLKTATADLLAKISIIVLILLIILLYRIRQSRSRRRVFSNKYSRKLKR